MRAVLLPLVVSVAVLAGQATPDKPSEPPVEFDGLIEATRVVHLSPPVDGLLERVTVDRGDYVQKDQIVATLESTVEKATLEITRARAELVAEVRKQQARLDYSRGKFVHDEELHKKGILSSDELEKSKTEMLLAEAGLLQAQENLRLAGLERDRAEATLKLRTIRSPIEGVVVERYLSPGELVTRQYQSKILGIAQIHPLVVQVLLPAAMFGKVTPGMKAAVKTELSPGKPFRTEVKTVDQVVDSASGTFRVRLELPNPDNRLPAGLKCRVGFEPTKLSRK